MPTRATRIKLMPGREGDAVIKAPSISAKLIVLKGLSFEKAREVQSLICDIHFLEELLAKAQIVGLFRELPHCIVIYNADIIAQEVANELGVEVELLEVDEVTGGTHYAPRVRGSRYPENFEPEPYTVEPEIEENIEEIERSFKHSNAVEEEAVEGPVVEWVEEHGCYFRFKTSPCNIEVEGEEEVAEIPVTVQKLEKQPEVIKATELSLKVKKVRELNRYEYPYVTFTVKAAELAAYAGRTVKVVLQLNGTTITRYATVRTVKELGRYVYGYVHVMARLPREMLQYVGKTLKARVTILPQ